MKEITISEIKEVQSLLKQMGEIVTPQNIASELHVSKTAMMKFLNDNSTHFKITKWVRKDKHGVITKTWLTVDKVFLDVSDNPASKEYTEKRKGVLARMKFLEKVTFLRPAA